MIGRARRQRHRSWRRRPGSIERRRPRQAAALPGLWIAFSGSVCGNSFAILADGRGSGSGILRPRASGSRLFGTSITKCILCLQPAGNPSGIGAGAEIKVGARRPGDRRAGILRDHQPAKRRLRLLRFDRKLALDEKRRAVDMQRLVDRDRAARRQRHALRADRLVLVGKLDFAKEDVGAVLPPHFFGAVGILLHPFPDPLHRHLVLRNDAAFDQDAADRRCRDSHYAHRN